MPAPLDRYEISDLLANLVERSMVVLDSETGVYHLTESMRAYASENLTEADAATPERHFEHFTEQAERLFALYHNGEEAAAHNEFGRQEGNFRAAYEWSMAHQPDGCMHLMACLMRPWHLRYPREAIDHAKRILAVAPDSKVEDQVWLRVQLAHISMRRSDLDLVAELLDRALQDLETVDIPRAKITALSTRALWRHQSGDEAAAVALMQETLRIAEASDLPRYQGSAHTNLGEFARMRGDYDEAKRHYEKALTLCESNFHSALNLSNLGHLSIEHGDPVVAERYYREGIEWLPDVGAIPIVCVLHGGLGMAYLLQGDVRRGGLLIGWSQSWASQQNYAMDPIDRRLFDRITAVGEQRWGAEFANAVQEGARMSLEEVRAEAL